MKPIQMVDLNAQHQSLRQELDAAIGKVINHGQFIQGPEVKEFELSLARWWGTPNVISCANGTDALYLAILALNLPEGAEVILPSFNYVSAAEVLIQAGLNPVFAEVNPHTFNLDPESVAACIGPKTKAIIVVHLFGQCAPMEEIMDLAIAHGLFVIEDNAQSLGAEIIQGKYKGRKAGTIGHIGTTSFFPTKILACMGDGGAVCTTDTQLAIHIRMLANHGQLKRYYYDKPGINSRLDTIQAAVLLVKLAHLDSFIKARQSAAAFYQEYLSDQNDLVLPHVAPYSTHVFHQYTLKVFNNKRDALRKYLHDHQVSSMVYYPMALHQQKAYSHVESHSTLAISEQLTREVLSLPMHSEISEEEIYYLASKVKHFFMSNP